MFRDLGINGVASVGDSVPMSAVARNRYSLARGARSTLRSNIVSRSNSLLRVLASVFVRVEAAERIRRRTESIRSVYRF